MTEHRINVTTELGGVFNEVTTSLSRAAAFATLSDQFSRLPEEVALPDPRVVLQVGNPSTATSAFRAQYAPQAASFAVVAIVGAFEVYLFRLLMVRRLCERASTGRVSGAELNDIRRRVAGEARARPTKLVAKLLTSPSENLRDALEWLEGIYRLRICLAHREGTVDVQDLDTRDVLTAKWRKTEFYAGDQRIDELPMVIDATEAPVSISVKFVDDERTWRLGERIEVNHDDCQQMAFALSQLANWLLTELNAELVALLLSPRPPT